MTIDFKMPKRCGLAILFCLAGFAFLLPLHAMANEPVLLTVTGNLSGGEQVNLSRKELLNLPQTTFKTETKWTDGLIEFSGPLLRDVLNAVGAKGENLRARALNDYAVDIPMADAEAYDVLVALSMDGEPMSIRDKGPMWIVYPWSDNRLLSDERIYVRSIWQLKSIDVE